MQDFKAKDLRRLAEDESMLVRTISISMYSIHLLRVARCSASPVL